MFFNYLWDILGKYHQLTLGSTQISVRGCEQYSNAVCPCILRLWQYGALLLGWAWTEGLWSYGLLKCKAWLKLALIYNCSSIFHFHLFSSDFIGQRPNSPRMTIANIIFSLDRCITIKTFEHFRYGNHW